MDTAPILAQAHNLFSSHPPPLGNLPQESRCFLLQFLRNDGRDRFANHLRRAITVEPFVALVPTDDGAGHILAENGVVGRFHSRREVDVAPPGFAAVFVRLVEPDRTHPHHHEEYYDLADGEEGASKLRAMESRKVTAPSQQSKKYR